MQEDVYRGDELNLYAYCGNNPVIYYDSSGYSHGNKEDKVSSNNEGAGNTGKLIGSLDKLTPDESKMVNICLIKERMLKLFQDLMFKM